MRNEFNSESVDRLMAHLRRRQRLLNALRWSAHGLCAGAVVALLIGAALALSRPDEGMRAVWMALPAVPIVGVIGAMIGILSHIDDLRLARAMDRASAGEDRLASAVQLSSHHRRERTNLIVEDALQRVGATPAAKALPLHTPRTLKWAPLPIVLLLCLFWLVPQQHLTAAAPIDPEISVDEWLSLHDEFDRELRQLPKPLTTQEQELQKQLEELAKLLLQMPEKKDALSEISRLSERIEQHRRDMGLRNESMKSAARAVSKSEALKAFASQLKQGNYEQAASELQKLSENLEQKSDALDASEFEDIAQDMENLAKELASQDELQEACQNCANAASSMNRQSLSQACKNFSDQLKKNADKLRQCDSMCKASSLLDQLKRSMNQCSQCSGCKNGCSSCKCGNKLVQCQGNGNKKGGLKAGWGSAPEWSGGSIDKHDEARDPDMIDSQERSGVNTSYKVVSPDERAHSGRNYEELYAEFVQKAEADLDLESVPVAYREYLRRYFNAIRPTESAPGDDDQ
jgi:Skp family chaperone for outer membrane proteins